VRRETMIVPAAGALDVDHLRAVMREQPRCPWPDGFPGEIEGSVSKVEMAIFR
jgi:hypothetical protein